MDGPEFDKLARKLTGFASRRQALGGLLGAAAAITGVAAADAKKGNGKGKDAKKGNGKGKDAKKNKGRGVDPDQCTTGCLFGGVFCVAGTIEDACGQNGTACSDCTTPATPANVCSPVASGLGGECRARVVCTGGNQCQFGAVCVDALTDTRVCGRRSVPAAGGLPASFVCNPRCQGTQTCQGTNPDTATCGTAACNPTNCPTGCCAANGTSCVTGDQITQCGRGGITCQNCVNICGLTNNGCNAGQCACIATTTAGPTTTTVAPTTTTVAPTTTAAPCGTANCAGCCDAATNVCRLPGGGFCRSRKDPAGSVCTTCNNGCGNGGKCKRKKK